LRQLLSFGAASALALFAAGTAGAQGSRFVLLPIEDRVSDAEISSVIEAALVESLQARGILIDASTARPVLRRLRLRRLEDVEPAIARRLAEDLGADWLIGLTIEEVWREPVAGVTFSARAVRAGEPEVRHAFFSAAGIDGLQLLGLGAVLEPERLVVDGMSKLLDQLALESPNRLSEELDLEERRRLGRVAVIPLTSPIASDASGVSRLATLALFSVLEEQGIEVVAENALASVLRRRRTTRWGELDRETRALIARELGAEMILTGSVGEFSSGWGGEPRPKVAVSLRALEAETGRIVWTDGIERDGWYRQKAFRRGRIRTRAELLEDLLTRLVRDLRSSSTAGNSEAVR
jgi:hypothetical protein